MKTRNLAGKIIFSKECLIKVIWYALETNLDPDHWDFDKVCFGFGLCFSSCAANYRGTVEKAQIRMTKIP
jgi:hypothetical protein